MGTGLRRVGLAGAAAAALIAVSSGAAFAGDCVNISKQNQAAGVQVVFNTSSDLPVWVSAGLQKRIDAGLVDPATGEGFHGLAGIDLDGDNVADISTFIVGPDDAIPETARASSTSNRPSPA